MYYKIKVEDYIKVRPEDSKLELEDAVRKNIIKRFAGYISEEIGIVIDLDEIKKIGEGAIVHEDPSVYYHTEFTLITFIPEIHEILNGTITEIEDFGAFINIGPMDGMIHISQVMDDFVSFSKDKVISGKKSNRTLKIGDECRARLIAVSFKDISNPKFGLTMRQPTLGKFQWIKEDKIKKIEKTKGK